MTLGLESTTEKEYNKLMITVTLNFTDSQFKDLQTIGKLFGEKSEDPGTTVVGSITRALQFIRFVGSFKQKEYELFAVDTKHTQVVSGAVVKNKLALLGTEKSIVNVNKEVNEILAVEEQMKDWNSFGMPVDPIPC